MAIRVASGLFFMEFLSSMTACRGARRVGAPRRQS
jgi:hypothetical protein